MKTVTNTNSTVKVHAWKTVNAVPSSPRPSMRWGHSSCIVGDSLYIFGGFANSAYMNDLWIYEGMQWKQLVTYGDIPEKRSNSTLCYDSVNNQLLLFGGGGANKQRFNTVSTLDLTTMNWIQISPFQSEASPWERTYHVAQFSYPYLMVFGGEGVDDLGDLWIYDVRSLKWEEVKTNSSQPCARRFHASCMVDNILYVFGGCEGKYVCLNDFYSLDVSSLLITGQTSNLKWEKRQLKGQPTKRWGHTLSHYKGELYIFGGRSDEDLNDLIAISLENNSIRKINTVNQPAARRRHGGGFIGSSLVLFGGFDGNYYDDLFYVNLYQGIKSKITSLNSITDAVVRRSTEYVLDNKNEKFSIYTALLGKYFEDQKKMLEFLNTIQKRYSREELTSIFDSFYKGWGPLAFRYAQSQFLSIIPGQQRQSLTQIVHSFIESPYLSIGELKPEYCVELQDKKFKEYLSVLEDHWQMNRKLIINNQSSFYFCDELVSLYSKYFDSLLNSAFRQDKNTIRINIECNPEAFQIVLAYLHTFILVVPEHTSYKLYKQIAKLAQYFSLDQLLAICEEQLCQSITSNNYNYLLTLSHQLDLPKLEQACSLKSLNQMMESSLDKRRSQKAIEESRLENKARELYVQMKFDLMHRQVERVPGKIIIESGSKGKQNQKGNMLDRKVSSQN